LISVCVRVDKLRGAVLWKGMCNGSINNIRQWKGYRRRNATNVREESRGKEREDVQLYVHVCVITYQTFTYLFHGGETFFRS